MLCRFCLTLILLCSTSVAAEDRVFRSAQLIIDGNLYADAVHVDFAEEKSPSEVIDMLRLMPRLETLVMGGPRFHDHQLMKLPNLKSLGVNYVDESFPDIPSRGAANRELKEQLRKALPNCKIY